MTTKRKQAQGDFERTMTALFQVLKAEVTDKTKPKQLKKKKTDKGYSLRFPRPCRLLVERVNVLASQFATESISFRYDAGCRVTSEIKREENALRGEKRDPTCHRSPSVESKTEKTVKTCAALTPRLGQSLAPVMARLQQNIKLEPSELRRNPFRPNEGIRWSA